MYPHGEQRKHSQVLGRGLKIEEGAPEKGGGRRAESASGSSRRRLLSCWVSVSASESGEGERLIAQQSILSTHGIRRKRSVASRAGGQLRGSWSLQVGEARPLP